MEKEKVIISFRDDVEIQAEIDRYAEARGLDRSNFIRQTMREKIKSEADSLK
jgi:hypothetical protein